MASTYDLPFVQGARLQVLFRYKVEGNAQSLTGYEFRGQIRAKADQAATLLLDLTPHLSIDGTDDTLLVLDVPATATAAVTSTQMAKDSASWDIFMWPTGAVDSAKLFIQGAVAFDPAVTDMRS